MWMEIAQSIALAVLTYSNATLPSDAAGYIDVIRNVRLIVLGCTAALYLVGHIFGGIGLYKIAKRAGNKHAWMAFVPLLNTYLCGEIAGEFTIFGARMKRGGLYAMLLEFAVLVLQVFCFTVDMCTLNPAFFVPSEEYGYLLDPAAMPAGAQILVLSADILTYIHYGLQLVMIFFMCVVYNAFFKKYYARSPFLMTFLCVILPARGYVLFAVRNNQAFDYNEYLRRKMEQYARSRQAPYGNNGGFGGAGGSGDAPFSDFGSGDPPHGGGGSDDAPFSDF